MKNEGIPVVREGLPFVFVCLVATVAFAVGGWWPAAIVFGLLTTFVAFFFRNPERLPPVGRAMIASPADGKVIYVGPAPESEFLDGQERLKISIFMSLMDVHVNRVPVDGTVRNIKYHKGRFMAAFEDRASEENERNALLIETPSGDQIVLVQVAGLVARRIVCYPTAGMFILKGQRMGLIRFGSRCDLYLPVSAKVLVRRGDMVLGGETTLAQLPQAVTEGSSDGQA
ncbi:MAG: phosphatidylserine decarboxylase family protein [Bdellovibrionota bacterium]